MFSRDTWAEIFDTINKNRLTCKKDSVLGSSIVLTNILLIMAAPAIPVTEPIAAPISCFNEVALRRNSNKTIPKAPKTPPIKVTGIVTPKGLK